jgi:hypothetical protein
MNEIKCRCGKGAMAFKFLKKQDFSEGIRLECCESGAAKEPEKTSERPTSAETSAESPVEVSQKAERQPPKKKGRKK